MNMSWKWLVLFTLTALPAWGAEPPNVLLVIADDQSWNDVGCYGSPNAITPNIDRLARQGMRFDRAFTATAMCAPTRQQLYTGLFPVRNGAYPNHSKVYPGTKSIVHHLDALGYRVGLSGKHHFGPSDSFPFENVAHNAIDAFINRDPERPYCLIVASHSPHLPWTAGDASQYDPGKLVLPPHVVDTPETRVAMTKYFAEITDFDREVGECLDSVKRSGSEDRTLFIYTSEQGANLPRCKWTCYETGLKTSLVIRWPEKVKPGSSTNAMVQYVDLVPTLIEAAGGDPEKIDTGRDGDPDGGCGFDGRSFLPVLLSKAERHHEYVYGVHTTRGIINGSPSYPIRSIRTETHKLIWNLQHDAAFQNIVTSARGNGGYWPSWVEKAKTDPVAKQCVDDYQHRPEFELYDLRTDPDERDNLADQADCQEQFRSLQTKLTAWMKQQNDQGIATELKAHERQGRSKKSKKKKQQAR